MGINYTESVKKALILDYQAIEDPTGYLGIYFIKDHKKWIHDIDALSFKLSVSTDKELEDLGYNVEDYYTYRDMSYAQVLQQIAQEEMLDIFGDTLVDGVAYIGDELYMDAEGNLFER